MLKPRSVLRLASPFALVLTASWLARAQSGDTATALTLFDQGKQLVRDGKFAEACPKFRASYEIVPKLGTLLNLADCYEKNGQTASAWARFTEATSMAEKTGETDRADFARQHASALSPHLARLTIESSSSAPGLEIKRDGLAVAAAVLGTPLPVDPGHHTIEAQAPGKLPWQSTIEVPDGAQMRLQVPALNDVPAAPPPPAPPAAAPAAAAAPAPPPPAPPETGGSSQKTWGLVAVIVGGAGLAGSLALGGMAMGQYGQSNQPGGCVNDVCPQQSLNDRNSAYGLANAATWLAVGGGVVAAAGLVLMVTSPSGPEHPRAALWVAPTPGGAGVGGAW